MDLTNHVLHKSSFGLLVFLCGGLWENLPGNIRKASFISGYYLIQGFPPMMTLISAQMSLSSIPGGGEGSPEGGG